MLTKGFTFIYTNLIDTVFLHIYCLFSSCVYPVYNMNTFFGRISLVISMQARFFDMGLALKFTLDISGFIQQLSATRQPIIRIMLLLN